MESVSELNSQEPEAAAERERSTIEFPYSDLDAAVELVKGVHQAGGTACDYDQLAAELKMEAKGGGFRLRVGGAKMFGLINYERGGRISLTDLGRQMIDQQQERAARVSAFLTVPLYVRVYEQFKGGPLPPQAGLERAIEAMGVGSKVKDKARQVMLRSAKQAGFFNAAIDRLVKPSTHQDLKPPHGEGGGHQSGQGERQKQPPLGGGGGGGGHQHPLIQGLLITLPAQGSDWAAEERANWLNMANSIFKMLYTGNADGVEVTYRTNKGGANSAG